MPFRDGKSGDRDEFNADQTVNYEATGDDRPQETLG